MKSKIYFSERRNANHGISSMSWPPTPLIPVPTDLVEMKITTPFAALGLLLAGCVPGSFQGEWIRGDFNTRTALATCQQAAKDQPYPAKCEVSEWSASNGYGEVWLINTASNSTKSGEEITKIWVLNRK